MNNIRNRATEIVNKEFPEGQMVCTKWLKDNM